MAPATAKNSASAPATTAACPVASSAPAAWASLFDGKSLHGWAVVQGASCVQAGAIVMDGRGGDVTILAPGVNLRNGQVEFELRRPAPAGNAGPFTFGLRTMVQLQWNSLYFVYRPETLEACRGSSKLKFPDPEQSCRLQGLPRLEGVEKWRFELNEERVDCYREGVKVMSYLDSSPHAGTLALTASKCEIQVLAARYRAGK